MTIADTSGHINIIGSHVVFSALRILQVEVNHVNVGAIAAQRSEHETSARGESDLHVFDRALTLIGAHWLRAIDARHANTITGARDIDEIIVHGEIDGLRSAALGYGLGGLLQLDDLFVGVEAAIVNECHAALRLTVRTLVRLHDPSSIHLTHLGLLAYHALEERSFEIGDDVAVSYNHALHADQLVNVCAVRNRVSGPSIVIKCAVVSYLQDSARALVASLSS